MEANTSLDPLVLAAYKRAVREFAGPLKGFAARILGPDAEWAEDVSQDTLLALYRHLHQIPEHSWKPWLYRVARNLCLDRIRRRKHRPRNFRDITDDDGPEIAPPSPWTQRPDVRLQDKEIQEALEKAIQDLSPKFREVYLLCERQELSYEQATSVLGIPLKTVSTRLFRARKKLVKAMQPFLHGEPSR